MRIKAPAVLLLLLAVPATLFPQQQPYFFVMLSDTQMGMYSGNRDFAQETANFEFAAAAVNRLKPGFVIILGDLVNKPGDAGQIGEYLRISGTISPTIPVYHVAGNHDVGNEPTPESLAAYRKNIGRDHYGFRAGPVYGIVLNSTLIHSPKNAMSEYGEQNRWLEAELEKAKGSGAKHVIVFQHHPLFLADAREPDRYENIPLERRRGLLDLFRNHAIRNVFAGHTHKNVPAREMQLAVVASGPVGKPLGQDGSGIRVARVTDAGVEHQYYDFGRLPEILKD